jgi:hypothetical protein
MRSGGTTGAALAALWLFATGALAETPRLVVVLAVDQLRPDRLDPTLPGGIGRLAREGRSYTEGVLDHSHTATCPGHLSIVAGRHPGPAGVPGNRHLERGVPKARYCVEAPPEEAAVIGAPQIGRSPAKIRVETLGDWLKAARPGARVFGVSPKDRSAIAMAGRHADGAYWMLAAPPGSVTTSTYYRAELPAWVTAFNGSDPLVDGFLADLPESWEAKWKLEGPRPDDFEGESDMFGRAFPHPLRHEDDPRKTLTAYAVSPFPDADTFEFSRELIKQEGLGADDDPDLLAIGLSSTDRVGHLYGPWSHESYDALRRLDEDLGAFMDFVESKVGPGRTLWVLSSDHGVLPLPEWLDETGSATCPVDGGRESLRGFVLPLYTALWWEFTPFWDWPEAWVHFAGADLNVNRALAAEHGIHVQSVIDFTEAWLEEQEIIAEVWTHDEIRDGTSEDARLYRNSFDPARSGDLVLQIREGCLISGYAAGTTHGTPYLYDRAVPIVFYGAGVEPGRVAGRARTIDIAPTIAEHLGIPTPPDLDGVPLD